MNHVGNCPVPCRYFKPTIQIVGPTHQLGDLNCSPDPAHQTNSYLKSNGNMDHYLTNKYLLIKKKLGIGQKVHFLEAPVHIINQENLKVWWSAEEDVRHCKQGAFPLLEGALMGPSLPLIIATPLPLFPPMIYDCNHVQLYVHQTPLLTT